MKRMHTYYLDKLGIERWVLRSTVKKPMSLNDLAKEVSSCTSCSLHQSRTQTVFARGNPNSSLMIIGEAPGFHEDQQGKPFVGKAGFLLNNMLASIGLNEESVYIANVLKCRPPENRDPTPHEIEACSNHLMMQITLVQPKLILALGRFAGQFLLKNAFTMMQMRNKVHHFESIPTIVTYHPAYLLRKPRDKKKTFEDLYKIKSILYEKRING